MYLMYLSWHLSLVLQDIQTKANNGWHILVFFLSFSYVCSSAHFRPKPMLHCPECNFIPSKFIPNAAVWNQCAHKLLTVLTNSKQLIAGQNLTGLCKNFFLTPIENAYSTTTLLSQSWTYTNTKKYCHNRA